MALYRFKVIFEDYDDVSRVIDIRSTQTFHDLHIAIQDAIGFDKQHMASFYLSDDHWKKGQEITLENMNTTEDLEDENAMPIPIMKTASLCDYIEDPHQKIVYIFDFLNMWTLLLELTGIIIQEDPKKTYPLLVKSEGLAPKQYIDKKFVVVEDEEFEDITEGFVPKEHEDGLDEEDETLFSNEPDAEEDEFGGVQPGAADDEKF